MEKMIDIIKDNIVIPKILLNKYKDLNINEKELIVLIYLINEKDNKFNPNKISNDLNLNIADTLEIIEKLNKEDLILIETKKQNDILEEIINCDNFYKKLSYLIINEKEEITPKTNIYDKFESEFSRTLSPIEYELINGWIEAGFSEELINMALKEAVFNGVSNLRYIDKILYEWKKKGIKSKEDVEKNKKNFQNKKHEKQEMFDYDWLNENE
jgi:DNA replication protein